MTKKSAREWLAAVLICIFGTFMIGGLVAALEVHGYASSEAAGWVQAVGSVAAIAVAIFLAKEQSDNVFRSELRNRLEAVNGLFLATSWAVEHINDAIQNAEGHGLHGVSTFRAATLKDSRSHVESYSRCADQLACISAINLAQILREAEESFIACDRNNPELEAYFLDKLISQKSLAEGVKADLAGHIIRLMEKCQKHRALRN